ncbi:MAG: energy-coupling factor transporter transmembrane component T family protein [Thermincolia bacterium]
MIKDITLGQYYPISSPLHNLDPRTKIVGLFLYMTSLFMIKPGWGYMVATVLVLALVFLSKVPIAMVLRSLRPIVIILGFSALAHLFFTTGRVWLEWGPLQITYEGAQLALYMLVRLVLLVMVASLLTYTTTPLDLTDGLETLMGPLAKVGIPAHELAMMVVIAIRFVPTLLDEADKIMKAQMARGARFDKGGLVTRVKSLVPLLVPLFVSSFRRADDLAIAMEARCYRGGQGRTRMKVLVMVARDYWALGLMAAWVITIGCIRIFW